jgi:hypothetical protein
MLLMMAAFTAATSIKQPLVSVEGLSKMGLSRRVFMNGQLGT